MKKKIIKTLGVGLAFMLVASLMVAFAPMAAAADYEENDWGEWGLPSIEEDSDVGPMAVAPDGTIYAYVAEMPWDGDRIVVQKSDDNGYTWDDTELELDFDPDNAISEIVISPNYEDDETVYVGTFGGTIYRLEEAGDANPIALRDIGGGNLYSIDVWYDGEDNWILAGTDDGVFEIMDAHGGDWIDYQLTNYLDIPCPGYEVAFAPDFDDIEIIWVVTLGWVDEDGDDVVDVNETQNFIITSTIAPGQWGQVISPAGVPDLMASPWVDLGFPDDYSSDVDEEVPLLFAALSSAEVGGGVYMIEGVEAPGNSVATMLMDDENIVSVAVSGDSGNAIILAGSLNSPEVYISDDGGASWDDVDKMPTGWYPFDPGFGPSVPEPGTSFGFSWTHVYMEADVVWDDGEVFDADDGMAFVSTVGFESAVSRSDDGGEVWNQTGLIDTEIDDILDLGFHPDFPGTPTFMMVTEDGAGVSSLWLTENGDSDEPDYMRMLAGDTWGDVGPGNFNGFFWLAAWSLDADAIYIHGVDDGGDPSIWRSTDDGQTFGSERSVMDGAWFNDWVIPDSTTIYAAGTVDGFYKSINSGLSWRSVDVNGEMLDIALSPNFEDDETILLGSRNGNVYMSDDEGDTFDDSDDSTADLLTGDVFVAFDADYADEDADGYMLIYAAGWGDEIQVGEVADTDDVDWEALEDDTDDATQEVNAGGLMVSSDNALYAITMGAGAALTDIEADGSVTVEGDVTPASGGTAAITASDISLIVGDFTNGEVLTVTGSALVATTATTASGTIAIEGTSSGATGLINVALSGLTGLVSPETVSVTGSALSADVTGAVAGDDPGVVRLLLHESDSLWEGADDNDLDDPWFLWLSAGSNVLWTIDWDDAELWVLEDTLSGQVTLDSPPDGSKLDRLEVVRIAWDELRGADDDYAYELNETSGLGTDIDGTTDDTDVNVSVTGSSEYDWKVRVAPGEPWHSRWSDEWTFNTALGPAPWAPTLYTPGGTWQYSGLDVELMPAFSWESAKNADGYQFVLADNAEFTSPLVNKKTPESAYNLDFELEYNSNYFWRVMAYKGNDAISRWSDIGAFTTIEKAAPAPPAPPPPATVTQPAPAPIVLPTPIPPALLWVIIGVGAALIIAVIVLIVRTRRPV